MNKGIIDQEINGAYEQKDFIYPEVQKLYHEVILADLFIYLLNGENVKVDTLNQWNFKGMMTLVSLVHQDLCLKIQYPCTVFMNTIQESVGFPSL